MEGWLMFRQSIKSLGSKPKACTENQRTICLIRETEEINYNKLLVGTHPIRYTAWEAGTVARKKISVLPIIHSILTLTHFMV